MVRSAIIESLLVLSPNMQQKVWLKGQVTNAFRVFFMFERLLSITFYFPTGNSATALVVLILMTLAISQSYIQDAPAPFSFRSSNGVCSNLLTSATLQDLCAPPALHSGPTFSRAH